MSAPLSEDSDYPRTCWLGSKASRKPCETQVVVPRLGKAFVLPVQLLMAHVLSADDVAAPLLDANEIVAVVVGV